MPNPTEPTAAEPGRTFDETTLFRLAYAYEQATDWGERRPPGV